MNTTTKTRPRRVAALAFVMLLAISGHVRAAEFQLVPSFGPNPGGLTMHIYLPDGPAELPENPALVVVLHGCTQTARPYADASGWRALADREGFALLLPEQSSANNTNRCFNWFEQADVTRGSGEVASIAAMVDWMIDQKGIDPDSVHVTGLSAGGFMTTALLAAYPERFAAGGIVAGGPYACGFGLTKAFSCMSPGVDRPPEAWADLVRSASAHAGPWPRVSIWHGDADYTVAVKNQTELVDQWTSLHGIDSIAETTVMIDGVARRETYDDASGATLVEAYTIPGMGHGTPIRPGSGDADCGSATAFVLDVGICSSYHLGRFFGIVDGSDAGSEPDAGADDDVPRSPGDRAVTSVGCSVAGSSEATAWFPLALVVLAVSRRRRV